MNFPLNFCFAWYQQAGRVAETESMLKLAENVNIVLPTAVYEAMAPCNKYDFMII